MSRRSWRRFTDRLMVGVLYAGALVAVLPLVLILLNLVLKGASSLNWAFFTRIPVPAGETGGGVANAIIGSTLIVGLASLAGLPIGVGAGFF